MCLRGGNISGPTSWDGFTGQKVGESAKPIETKVVGSTQQGKEKYRTDTPDRLATNLPKILASQKWLVYLPTGNYDQVLSADVASKGNAILQKTFCTDFLTEIFNSLSM